MNGHSMSPVHGQTMDWTLFLSPICGQIMDQTLNHSGMKAGTIHERKEGTCYKNPVKHDGYKLSG